MKKCAILAIAAVGVGAVAWLFHTDLYAEGWTAIAVTWFLLLAASDI